MTEYSDELRKLKYQIRLLGEAVDSTQSPITSLVISFDWGEEDLDRAHDIFESYDEKLRAGEEVRWTAFEMALREQFHIGYQRVKSIVLAFYRNHQWTAVCRGYAHANDCMEFHEITKSSD